MIKLSPVVASGIFVSLDEGSICKCIATKGKVSTSRDQAQQKSAVSDKMSQIVRLFEHVKSHLSSDDIYDTLSAKRYGSYNSQDRSH